MKYSFYYALGLAAVFAGCNESDIANESVPEFGSGQIVRAIANTGSETRLSVADVNNQLTLKWDKADEILVINGKQGTSFSLISGDGSAAAEFEGSPVKAYVPGESLFAIYNPAISEPNGFNLDENGNLFINLGKQTGELTGKYQYMYAQSTYDGASSPIPFNFRHLVSVLKINVALPDNVTGIDSLVLMTNDVFYDRGTLILNTPIQGPYSRFDVGEVCYDRTNVDYSQLSHSVSVDHFTVNNNIATTYVYVLPSTNYSTGQYNNWQSSSWIEPSFIAYSNGKILTNVIDFNGKSVQPGRMYEIDTDLCPLPELSLGENPYVKSWDLYAFTPKESGLYWFENMDFEFVSEDIARINGYYALTANKTYLVRITYVDAERGTPIISRVNLSGELSVGDAVSNLGIYSFTPTEDGYYKFINGYGWWYDTMNWNNGIAFLTAGRQYTFELNGYDYGGNYPVKLVKGVEKVIKDTLTITDDFVVLSYTPSESGTYGVKADANLSWMVDMNRWMSFQDLEANNSYTIFLTRHPYSSGSSVANVSMTKLTSAGVISANATYSLTPNSMLSFTPEFDGWYYIESNDWNFNIDYTDRGWMSEWGFYYFYAGATYYFTTRSYQEMSLKLIPYKYDCVEFSEINKDYSTDPDHIVMYLFTAPEDGTYNVVSVSGRDFYWRDYYETTHTFKAGETATILVAWPKDNYGPATFRVEKQ